MFRYIGSKGATADTVRKIVSGLENVTSVADAYGGIGTIGSVMKSAGYRVDSCDALTFPHAFQVARIECNVQPRFQRVRQEVGVETNDDLARFMTSVRDEESWFVREYSDRRQFFTHDNATAIAGAWGMIRDWSSRGLLSRLEGAYLVASFLNSMDAVANTAGTYYAFLKETHRKAKRPFCFSWLPVTKGNPSCSALLGDALERLRGREYDLLYLDPPYNKRNYAHYYHLPETLAHLAECELSDSTQAGVPLIPHFGAESVRRGTDLDYIESLIENVRWRHLIVHYCDDAHISLDKLRSALRHCGRLSEHKIDALGYTTKNAARKAVHHVFVVTH